LESATISITDKIISFIIYTLQGAETEFAKLPTTRLLTGCFEIETILTRFICLLKIYKSFNSTAQFIKDPKTTETNYRHRLEIVLNFIFINRHSEHEER